MVVYSPVRDEYIGLVAQAPLDSTKLAFDIDIDTGTGVLAALLAKRGAACIVATDMNSHALACPRENLARLNVTGNMLPSAGRPIS